VSTVRISRANWDGLIAHAREEAPNECCGYARLDDGRVDEVFRGQNTRLSPYGFDLDGPSLLAANELDADGHGVAVYHSHPRSPAEPSEQDKNLAQYPHWIYLIVSLDGEPHVRAWRIVDGRVEEEALDVD
jgi:[CysO sulfur-carrier protein]-S-L-cysteine hydrolase